MAEGNTQVIYTNTGKRRGTCYLGDGVFAEYDDAQIWLTTSREGGIVHEIALDDATFTALVEYAATVRRLVTKRAAPNAD
jgi:hypothetical protein